MGTFDWSNLGSFKSAGAFPADYPANVRRFFAPFDKVHDVLANALSSASQSLVIGMYGEDDPELTDLIVKAAENPAIFVQVNLDKTQAAGLAERGLVEKLKACPATRVAIGESEFHKINHVKMAVIDGQYTVTGSTNWSADGESKQNNELTITNDRVLATEARHILDLEHQTMLSQGCAHDSTYVEHQGSLVDPATGHSVPRSSDPASA